MPSIILSDNGVSSGSAGLKSTAASDGALSLQTTTAGGTATTAISIDTSQNVTFTNQPTYSGGTANGVAYLNGSKVLTTGSALTFNGSTLSLTGAFSATGISTVGDLRITAPSAGNYNSTFQNTDTTLDFYASLSAGISKAQRWFANGGATPNMTLDASGNLGLGVTPSAWSGYKAIDIASGGAVFGYPTNYAGLASNCYNNGSGWRYKNTAVAGLYQLETNTHVWYTAASGTAGNAITFTQAMTLDASGNLGVGSTSPNIGGLTRALTLNTPTAGNYSGLELAGAGTLSARFVTNNGGTYFGSQLSIPLILETGATERARIDSSGNLLVGTTSNNSTSRTVIRATQNVLNLDNAGGQYTTLTYSNNDVAKAYVYYDNTNTRTYVQTGASGGVYLASGGTSWTAVSDERVKDIIEPIENANQKIASWRTVIGKYKADTESVRRSFLIAQDVLETFPEAVDSTNADEYGLNYQDLIPVLVKAIQEQQSTIQQLQADVAALKGAQA